MVVTGPRRETVLERIQEMNKQKKGNLAQVEVSWSRGTVQVVQVIKKQPQMGKGG